MESFEELKTNTRAPVSKSDFLVHAQIDDLNESIMRLENYAEGLENRLETVSRPQHDTDMEDPIKAFDGGPLSTSLNALVTRIKTVNRRIDRIIERLEI